MSEKSDHPFQWKLVIPAGFEPHVLLSAKHIFNFAGSNDRLEKGEKSDHLFQWKMVIPAGFEPATYCLEGSCSIQLS